MNKLINTQNTQSNDTWGNSLNYLIPILHQSYLEPFVFLLKTYFRWKTPRIPFPNQIKNSSRKSGDCRTLVMILLMSYWAIPAFRTWLWEKSLQPQLGTSLSECLGFSPDGHSGWINMEALVAQESKATQFHLLQKQSSAWGGNTRSGDENSVSMKKLIQFNNLQQDFMLKTSIYFCTRKKTVR